MVRPGCRGQCKRWTKCHPGITHLIVCLHEDVDDIGVVLFIPSKDLAFLARGGSQEMDGRSFTLRSKVFRRFPSHASLSVGRLSASIVDLGHVSSLFDIDIEISTVDEEWPHGQAVLAPKLSSLLDQVFELVSVLDNKVGEIIFGLILDLRCDR